MTRDALIIIALAVLIFALEGIALAPVARVRVVTGAAIAVATGCALIALAIMAI